MDESILTVYIPKVDPNRVCHWDKDDLILGWNVPKLNSTVIVASYPATQRAVVVCHLRKLHRIPRLRQVFAQHGELSLLQGFNIKQTDAGFYMKRSNGRNRYVQPVRYNPKDFSVVSFDELMQKGSDAADSSIVAAHISNEYPRLSSYLITGCALAEYMDKKLVNTALESQCSAREENAPSGQQLPSKRHKQQLSIHKRAYICLLHMVISVAEGGQYIVDAISNLLSNVLLKYMSKFATVKLLRDRRDQIAEMKHLWQRLQQEPDVLEYIALRHDLRQKVVSLLLEMFVGTLEFLFFQSVVFYTINKVGLFLRTLYVSTLKYMAYQFTIRIGKYFKINDEVAVFLSRLLLSQILVWNVVKPHIKKYLFVASALVKYTAFLGVSFQIAVLTDVMTIHTMHITYAHSILYYITKWNQSYLFSLLQLFKGKKWNELKRSLDSNKYTREQLFLGTVIFTLLLLIYPTIWTFYLVTWVVYLPIVVARAVSEGIIKLITRLPSYFVVYNLLFPSKFKDSVYFVYDKRKALQQAPSCAKVGCTENSDDQEESVVVLQHTMELRCSQFYSKTLLKPIADAFRASSETQFFWSPF